LIIVFVGVPGSGKTTLAKKIEEEFKAIRIDNVEIKEIIKEKKLAENSEEAQKLYRDFMFNLIGKDLFANKLIILDKGIDREYKKYFELFERKKWKYFVIKIKIPKEKAIENIMKRQSEDLNVVKTSMERWFKEWRKYLGNVDLEIDGNNIDYKKVFKNIKSRLNS